MEIRQGYRMAALRGADAFLDANADRLPSVSPSGCRLRLKEQIEGLERAAATQTGSTIIAAGETARQKELRRVLVQEHLAPVVRIARADLKGEPSLGAIARLPSTSTTHEVLISMALGMAVAAEEHKHVFIAAGLPEAFLEELREAAAALQGAIDLRTAAYGNRHGATVGIAVQLSAASRTVCVLDALVKKDLRGDADRLEEWKTVKTAAVKPGPSRGVEAVVAVHAPVQLAVAA